MALSDVKVRTAKPEAKAYKLTEGDGMGLLDCEVSFGI